MNLLNTGEKKGNVYICYLSGIIDDEEAFNVGFNRLYGLYHSCSRLMLKDCVSRVKPVKITQIMLREQHCITES